MPWYSLTPACRSASRWLGAAVALALAAPAAAETVLVTATGDAAGTCPGAACTLRAAIAAAADGDDIAFDPALLPADIVLTSALGSSATFTITGPGADRLSVTASGNQRVLQVNAGALAITGIALRGGRSLGTSGNNAGSGTGGAGAFGAPAEGGCVRIAAGASLLLERVALQDCEARGGNGGNGGSGSGGFSGGPGGPGASGGPAMGGAIAVRGTLVMLDGSIDDARALGGAGGDGGDGGNGTATDGAGGTGGTGANATGGALWVAAGGALVLENTTLFAGQARAGNGGRGGDTAGTAGAGGSGGIASGGQLAIASGASDVDLMFATLAPAIVTGGLGGQPGSGTGNAPPGLQGNASGELLADSGAATRTRGIAAIGTAAVGDCSGALEALGANADSDGSCSGFTLQQSFATAFAAQAQDGVARALRPAADALLVDAGDCQRLEGQPIAHDQLGNPRPVDGDSDGVALCDVGAVEYTPALFADGFED